MRKRKPKKKRAKGKSIPSEPKYSSRRVESGLVDSPLLKIARRKRAPARKKPRLKIM